MKLLKLEFYKLRRKKVFLTILLFIVAEFIINLWDVRSYGGRHGFIDGWKYLSFMYTSFNGLVMPIMIAVIASRLSDIEHKGATLKLLLTQVSSSQIYMAKFICITILMAFVVLLQIFGMSILGFVFHFPEAYPAYQIAAYGMGTFAASLPIIALQLGISMIVPNQMFSMILGLVGGFAGIMSEYLPTSINHFVLWSDYTSLSTITTTFTDKTLRLYTQPMPMMPLFAVLGVTVIIYASGSFIFKKKEW